MSKKKNRRGEFCQDGVYCWGVDRLLLLPDCLHDDLDVNVLPARQLGHRVSVPRRKRQVTAAVFLHELTQIGIAFHAAREPGMEPDQVTNTQSARVERLQALQQHEDDLLIPIGHNRLLFCIKIGDDTGEHEVSR